MHAIFAHYGELEAEHGIGDLWIDDDEYVIELGDKHGRIKGRRVGLFENEDDDVVADVALLFQLLIVVWCEWKERGDMIHDFEPIVAMVIAELARGRASDIKPTSEALESEQRRFCAEARQEAFELWRCLAVVQHLVLCFLIGATIDHTKFIRFENQHFL